jgi:hypothetical protein
MSTALERKSGTLHIILFEILSYFGTLLDMGYSQEHLKKEWTKVMLLSS